MVHDQAAGFALDALDADEARAYERHLLGCPKCRADVETLRATAAALAFAGDLVPPPSALRRRVLEVGDAVVMPIRRSWTRPVAVAAAAVAAVVAIVVGLHGSTKAAPLAAGVHTYALQGRSARGGLLLVTGERAAVLLTQALPDAAPGRAYELWVVRGGTAAPAGFLRRGMGVFTRPVPLGASVAVSLESAGGSRRPTGPLLITAETA